MNTLILTNNLITLDNTGKIVAYALSLVLIFLSTFFVAYKIKRARAFILFTSRLCGFLFIPEQGYPFLGASEDDLYLQDYKDPEYWDYPPVSDSPSEKRKHEFFQADKRYG